MAASRSISLTRCGSPPPPAPTASFPRSGPPPPPPPNNTTKPLPEIKLMVDVTAPGLTFTGNLGFLKLNATDHGTHLTGELDVDLQDGPDADTKLPVPELNSAPQLIKSAKISGNSHP